MLHAACPFSPQVRRGRPREVLGTQAKAPQVVSIRAQHTLPRPDTPTLLCTLPGAAPALSPKGPLH